MNENYIVINGKKIELTDEQLKALGIQVETKRRSPFKRVEQYNNYYRVTDTNCVDDYVENFDATDNRQYDVANYFNDKEFAKQVALHQLLYRKLLKFAYDNGCEDTAEWDGSNAHWAIRYSGKQYGFSAYSQERYKARDVYFSSEKSAERAIYEVVVPFMKEHPEFVW